MCDTKKQQLNLKNIFFYVQGLFLVLKGQKKTTNMKWLKNILASITDDVSMNKGSIIGRKVHH